jgi:hypothetical protein
MVDAGTSVPQNYVTGILGVVLQRVALVADHLREGPVHLSSGDLK